MGNKIVWSLLILLISFAACGKSSKNNVARQPNLSSTPLVRSDPHTIGDIAPLPIKDDEEAQAENDLTILIDTLKGDNAALANLNEVTVNEVDRVTNENKELTAERDALVDKTKSIDQGLTACKATISGVKSAIINTRGNIQEDLHAYYTNMRIHRERVLAACTGARNFHNDEVLRLETIINDDNNKRTCNLQQKTILSLQSQIRDFGTAVNKLKANHEGALKKQKESFETSIQGQLNITQAQAREIAEKNDCIKKLKLANETLVAYIK
jgi:plasmid maintenance system antidote protein VapI